MRVGVPRETKEGERRVALLPGEVRALVDQGHEVRIERGAGAGVGVPDDEYARAGAIVSTTGEAWGCELVVKVKELLDEDLEHAPRDGTVFGFQQLPGWPERTRAIARRGLTAIAYELVRDARGGFPLLAPMSIISGRMAVEAVWPLLPPQPRVLILGAGNAGLSAARTAQERGARVQVITRSESSRSAAERGGFAASLVTPEAVERAALDADLIVGAAFRPGEPTPKLVPRALVARMKRGAVIADISIDGGGVAETSRPTSHAQPIRIEEGVAHYAISNIPGSNPAAATEALSGAALPFVARLATQGITGALRADAGLRSGVLLWRGHVTHPGIAAEAGLPYTSLSEEIAA